MYRVSRQSILVALVLVGCSSVAQPSSLIPSPAPPTPTPRPAQQFVDGQISTIPGKLFDVPRRILVYKIESHPTAECHRVITYRFTNFGLLDASQID